MYRNTWMDVFLMLVPCLAQRVLLLALMGSVYMTTIGCSSSISGSNNCLSCWAEATEVHPEIPLQRPTRTTLSAAMSPQHEEEEEEDLQYDKNNIDFEDDEGPLPPPDASKTPHPSSTNTASPTHPKAGALLILCAADGTVYSLDAWTGEFRSSQSTGGPLLTRSAMPAVATTNVRSPPSSPPHAAEPATDASSLVTVLPGLDGRLYWHTAVGKQDSPSASSASSLEPLPFSMASLLDHPIRSCLPDHTQCGILSATVHNSFLALNVKTGQIQWTTLSPPSSTSRDEEEGDQFDQDDLVEDDSSPFLTERMTHPQLQQKKKTVLLQRRDYWVQQLSAQSGQQLWNVSSGSFIAVDFEEEQDPIVEEEMSPDDIFDDENIDPSLTAMEHHGKHQHRQYHKVSNDLPSLVFSDGGRDLIAIDPETDSILWRVDAPHILTAVFGIAQGRWKAVSVLEDSEFWSHRADQEDFPNFAMPASMESVPLLGATSPAQTPHAFRRPPQINENDILWEHYTMFRNKQRQRWQTAELSVTSQQQLPGYGSADFAKPVQCLTGECLQSDATNHGRTSSSQGIMTHHLPLPPPNSLATGEATLYSPEGSSQPVSVQPRGLLLSWNFVLAVVVCGFVCLAMIRKWQQQILQSVLVSQLASPVSSTSSSSNSSSVMGRAGHPLQQGSDMDPIDKSHDVENNQFSIEKTNNTNNNQDAISVAESSASASSHQQKTPRPAVSIQQGGIPLVQYSRYQSEFEELESLGEGGFGSVFRCRNNLDGRDYAIKKVRIRGAMSDPSFQQQLQRVLREVKILAVLDHPHIVRYYTAWLELDDNSDEDDRTGRRTSAFGTTTTGGGEETTNHGDSFSSDSRVPVTETGTEYLGNYQNSNTTSTSSWNPAGWRRSTFAAASSSAFSTSDHAPFGNRKNTDASDDCGIVFEDSTKDQQMQSVTENRSRWGTGPSSKVFGRAWKERPSTDFATHTTASKEVHEKKVRHTLYIQMQLCRFDTVGDFLGDAEARQGGNSGEDGTVDIPVALSLFLQVAKAVEYVHQQGLIHRDLKPSNCFMDTSGVIKVGDFGLSRETTGEQLPPLASVIESVDLGDLDADRHTAGVGTRLYASPEQASGPSYDASTDVYSLGIILFEMCYAMYTGMERNICLSQLRQKRQFPSDWDKVVGKTFPALRPLITSMLDPIPSSRPSSSRLVQELEELMGGLTILSPPAKPSRNMIFLRVESNHLDDPLQNAISHIRAVAQPENVEVLQYGMSRMPTENKKDAQTDMRQRLSSGHPVVTMEFALGVSSPEVIQGPWLAEQLCQRPHILHARHVASPLPPRLHKMFSSTASSDEKPMDG